jgi:type VI secretion system protein ImpA
MAIIDIDALLAPVSEEAPSGENLEYGAVAELERLATGNPGKLDPETREMVGAEEPEWRKVRDTAQEVFGQTKDLRVAVLLTRALLSLNGLAGLGEGLLLVKRLCEEQWDGVHPRLDPDEGDDPVERLNALANLDDPDGMLRVLRNTRLVSSREVGNYTVRDLDLMLGRMTAPEGTQVPTQGLMEAAFATGDPQENTDRRAGVDSGLQACNDLIKLFRDKTGDAPSIDNLRGTLKRIKDFYDGVASDGAAEAAEGSEEGAEAAPGGAPGGTGAKAGGALASRADAIKNLQQIAQFLRKTEPSSPAPMFIDRAVKMLQSDFLTIVKELMPDSKERIEMLGGVVLDPESE